MDLMARYDDNHFELAIVDPPYGLNIAKTGSIGRDKYAAKDWDSQTPNQKYFVELKSSNIPDRRNYKLLQFEYLQIEPFDESSYDGEPPEPPEPIDTTTPSTSSDKPPQDIDTNTPTLSVIEKEVLVKPKSITITFEDNTTKDTIPLVLQCQI